METRYIAPFQFTHPRRVRRLILILKGLCLQFQFTHPRRVRLGASAMTAQYISRFNSRTHIGCDVARLDSLTKTILFQFTHPRGVRHMWLFQGLWRIVCFNSRTHAGCALYLQGGLSTGEGDFNSLSHADFALHPQGGLSTGEEGFTSCTHEGCDL